MAIDITALYERYGPMVFRRCRALLGNEEAALDALQEVFILVLRHQGRFREAGHSSLLYTMATNHCLNVMKARRRELPAAEAALETLKAPDRTVESVLAHDALDRIFSLVGERTRTIAWLHFVDQLTLEETARAVHMSVSGIRKRLRRLQAIGQAIEENRHDS